MIRDNKLTLDKFHRKQKYKVSNTSDEGNWSQGKRTVKPKLVKEIITQENGPFEEGRSTRRMALNNRQVKGKAKEVVIPQHSKKGNRRTHQLEVYSIWKYIIRIRQ